MEKNVKTVVLDFYGLPGSGKTTLSHKIAEKLSYSSNTIAEPSYNYDHKLNPLCRKLKKLFDSFCFSITNFKCFVAIVNIVRNNTTLGIGCFSDIINITTKVAMISRYQNKRDYIVFDEGIAQAAISLVIDTPEKASNVFQDICKLLDTPYCIKLVRVDCKRDVALDRVLKRKSNDTRVEKMDNEIEMNRYMEKFEKAVNSINAITVTSSVEHCNYRFLEEL